MWKELIQGLTDECKFAAPAPARRLAAVEKALGVKFPPDLRGLLGECNGVVGEHGVDLIWPVERIEQNNLAFRSNRDFRKLYMPFDHLLFFADAGNGDQFAYPIQAGVIRRPDVFAWNHENDSRVWVAPSLEQYLDWWVSGRIEL